jgi:hypothetical protein
MKLPENSKCLRLIYCKPLQISSGLKIKLFESVLGNGLECPRVGELK